MNNGVSEKTQKIKIGTEAKAAVAEVNERNDEL